LNSILCFFKRSIEASAEEVQKNQKNPAVNIRQSRVPGKNKKVEVSKNTSRLPYASKPKENVVMTAENESSECLSSCSDAELSSSDVFDKEVFY
jgi:hypothetical protein